MIMTKPVCIRSPSHPILGQILSGLSKMGVTTAHIRDKALSGSIALIMEEDDIGWCSNCSKVVRLKSASISGIPTRWVVLRIYFRHVSTELDSASAESSHSASSEAIS